MCVPLTNEERLWRNLIIEILENHFISSAVILHIHIYVILHVYVSIMHLKYWLNADCIATEKNSNLLPYISTKFIL